MRGPRESPAKWVSWGEDKQRSGKEFVRTKWV